MSDPLDLKNHVNQVRFPVQLTLEEVSFIVSGLKDLNDRYLIDKDVWNGEDLVDYDRLIRDNEHCIEMLEMIYTTAG